MKDEERTISKQEADAVIGEITRRLKAAGIEATFTVYDLGKIPVAPFDPRARCNCLGCRIRRAQIGRN